MTWTMPICDRTTADVSRVKELEAKGYENFTESEKAEWDGGLKGALNTKDLQRITGNIEVLTGKKLEVPMLCTSAFFIGLYDEIKAIRDNNLVYRTTPDTPERPFNSYIKINSIEQILKDVHSVLEENNKDRSYCGEIAAGGSYLM